MYNVVFRSIADSEYKGVITWTSFNGKEGFDEWNDAKMQSCYEVVEEGVTRERALELCLSPKARNASDLVLLRKIFNILDEMSQCAAEIEALSKDEADAQDQGSISE